MSGSGVESARGQRRIPSPCNMGGCHGGGIPDLRGLSRQQGVTGSGRKAGLGGSQTGAQTDPGTESGTGTGRFEARYCLDRKWLLTQSCETMDVALSKLWYGPCGREWRGRLISGTRDGCEKRRERWRVAMLQATWAAATGSGISCLGGLRAQEGSASGGRGPRSDRRRNAPRPRAPSRKY
jgi:hypothetical protein